MSSTDQARVLGLWAGKEGRCHGRRTPADAGKNLVPKASTSLRLGGASASIGPSARCHPMQAQVEIRGSVGLETGREQARSDEIRPARAPPRRALSAAASVA